MSLRYQLPFYLILIFLIFACAGELMFPDISSFSSFKSSMITLFGSGLGNFDFTIFDSITNFSPVVGYIFLAIYLLTSMIMLINFLIAILSNTYGILTLQNNALYLKEVILLRQRYAYEKHFSSLVSAFVPLNLASLALFPVLSVCKSQYLNTFCLYLEYTLFGFISVVLYFISVLILLPFSYLFLIVSKSKYIFKKPSFGCKDKTYRILDLFTFIFIGLFWLLFYCFYDTVIYTVHLYYEDIKKVQEDNFQLVEINKQPMNETSNQPAKLNQNKAKKIERIKNKYISTIVNPVKEGLSDLTLKIITCTLAMLRKETIKERKLDKTMKNLNSICLFLNVNVVMRRLYKCMYIQEHINQVCLGMHYVKSKEFFNSKIFSKLIKEIQRCGDDEAITNADQSQDKTDHFNKIFQTDTENKQIDFKTLYWRNKIQLFLYNSEQKWILDQYNFAKRFIIQNSIDIEEDQIVDADYYSQTVNEEIAVVKSRTGFTNANTKSSVKSDSIKIKSDLNCSKESDEIKLMATRGNPGEKVKKVDINALINTINEIELYLPMKHILTDNKIDVNNLLNLDLSRPEYKKNVTDYNRKQYSMCCFSRNFKAIEKMHKILEDNESQL